MSKPLILGFAVSLMLFADVPWVSSFKTPAALPSNPFSGADEVPVFPDSPSATPATQIPPTATATTAAKSGPLQDNSKLSLIRYVSGEYAKAVKPLPAGKDGFLLYVGQPVDSVQLDRAVANRGAAVNPGDNVQITKLEFHDHQIIVDLNGGGRGKKGRLRDHIHLDMGGIPSVQTTDTAAPNDGPTGLQPVAGSTIFLEFKKALPDMSPEDLKQILSPLLDFNRQRSASVHWIDTLPPEVKRAIQERKPVVGMDREEVIAAIGKPEHKVRERDPEGNDIEDWIYGQPPAKTVFVRFSGERVTSVKQFPQ